MGKREREAEKVDVSIADKLLRKQEHVKRETGNRSSMVPDMLGSGYAYVSDGKRIVAANSHVNLFH